MQRRLVVLMVLASSVFLLREVLVSFHPRLQTPATAGPQAPTPAESMPDPNAEILRVGSLFEQVAARVSPACVYVEATKPAKPAASGRPGVQDESGSGVLVRLDGQRGLFALTNNHVIAQAPAEQITLNLADGRIYRPSRVWADPESDIAVLQMPVDNLPVAPMGDSDKVRVGQWVLAIGSPFGLNQTVTHGIISARDRGQIGLGSTIRIKDFLQTDAAINPGSSGGPLVNLQGEVIGINTAIASHTGGSNGVAFSIPVNLVKRVARQLLEKGAVSRGYLGMQLATSFEPADAFRLGLDRVRGAWIETIYPDTPAQAAGLKVNDVIMQVDNVSIRNENHLINHISMLSPGQKVQLQVWRERRTLMVDAVVGDWARGQSQFRRTQQSQPAQ